MIVTAIILFLIGAVGGLAIAVKSFRRRSIPWAWPVAHGIFGAAGLLVLLDAVVQDMGGSQARAALVILLIAALGGFFLLSFHVRKKDHPKAVIVLHALIAVIGVLLLIAGALRASVV